MTHSHLNKHLHTITNITDPVWFEAAYTSCAEISDREINRYLFRFQDSYPSALTAINVKSGLVHIYVKQ